MEPTITWLDLTASDRDRMQRVLDLFGEAGTVDELGLGTLRDALSNALFPGSLRFRRGCATCSLFHGVTECWSRAEPRPTVSQNKLGGWRSV